MHPTILAVDTAAGLCLIDETLIPPESKKDIIPVSDIMLRSATNHQFALTWMIKLYVRMCNAIFPFYFGIVSNLPSGTLVGTSFISKNIKTICPTKYLMRPADACPVRILAHNDRNVLAIQHPQSLAPFDQVEQSVNIRYARKTTISPMTQQLITVNAPIN